MGLIPAIAAPTPAPINEVSVIGVSLTLSFPNSSLSPFVVGLHGAATFSPKRITFGSFRSASL
jgi:hypothetical protein